MVGRAKRQLSCLVITQSWSRALYLEFFLDQTTENFLRGCGHVRAFSSLVWSAQESFCTTISKAQYWNAAGIRFISNPQQNPRCPELKRK